MSCKHSNKQSRATAQGYWELVEAGEPFRLLFPLGAVLGIFGVLLWPLYIWNITGIHPGIMHSRIMVQGFLACFVIGFLGTALPRLLDVPRIKGFESVGFAAALTAITALHAASQHFWADQLFFATLGLFLLSLGARSLFRKDVPPPAFVLVALGMLSGLLGTTVQVLIVIAPASVPGEVLTMGRLLMNQGFLLLPVMGVGAFLLPRFFGMPNRQNFPESIALPPGWGGRALFALGCGMLVLAGFAWEASGNIRAGCALRAVAVTVYFLREIPVHKQQAGGGTLAMGLRIALFSIPAGYLLTAVWPQHSASFLHVVFITGFSLITFIVASRVVLGHSGQSEKFRAFLPPVLVMVALLALAMLTRVSADWMPAIRMSHYAYAALAWVAGVMVWMWTILPGIRRADSEQG